MFAMHRVSERVQPNDFATFFQDSSTRSVGHAREFNFTAVYSDLFIHSENGRELSDLSTTEPF